MKRSLIVGAMAIAWSSLLSAQGPAKTTNLIIGTWKHGEMHRDGKTMTERFDYKGRVRPEDN